MEKQKKCFKCNKQKNHNEFYKHPQMLDGRVNKCKECNKKDVRDNYAKTVDERREYDTERYRYSIPRILNHKYSCIKTRCIRGRSNGKKYFVTGKPFLSKEEFMEWAYSPENMEVFLSLYNNWQRNGFDNKLSPSIDRINSKKSYLIGNLQWLSKSDNCKKYNK